jgi:hypothetical protein
MKKAIGADVGSLGSLYNLSSGVNDFNQAALVKQLQTSIPNYNALVTQQSTNIGNELGGQVPTDVINELLQKGAERGIATGGAGSPNANAAYMRALGLTSLDLTKMGEQGLSTAIGESPKAPLFDLSKMFVSPSDEQQAQLWANIYGAAPQPKNAALAAQNAARSGFNAGAGSVPGIASPGSGVPSSFANNWYDPQQIVAGSTGGGTSYGGETYYGNDNPDTAYKNWNQWYSGVPTSVPDYMTSTGTNTGADLSSDQWDF